MSFLLNKLDYFYGIVSLGCGLVNEFELSSDGSYRNVMKNVGTEVRILIDSVTKHHYNVTFQFVHAKDDGGYMPPVVLDETEVELVRQRALSDGNKTVLSYTDIAKQLALKDFEFKRKNKRLLEQKIAKSK